MAVFSLTLAINFMVTSFFDDSSFRLLGDNISHGDDNQAVPQPIGSILWNHSSLAAKAFPECYRNHSNSFWQQLEQDLGHDKLLSDFDWTTQASCGLNKCFYPSRSNASIGYLVAADRVDSTKKMYDNMRRSVWLEQILRRNISARVLSLDLPALADVTTQNALVCLLADRTYQPSRPPEKQEHVFVPNDSARHHQQQLVIQKVWRVPEPYLLLGWSENKMNHLRRQLPAFLERLDMPDRHAFVQQLTTELKIHLPSAIPIVPALEYDLQGLVDAKGRFYHIVSLQKQATKTRWKYFPIRHKRV